MAAQIDIYDLYLRLLADINSQQGGHVKPYGNFIKWVYEISMELYKEYFDNWEKSQRVSDALSIPFLKSRNVVVSSVPGRAYDLIAYPSDYGHYSSARVMFSPETKSGCICKGLSTYDGKTGLPITKESPSENSKYVDPDELSQQMAEEANNVTEISISKVDNGRWGSALDNKIVKVSFRNGIITQDSEGFKIAPKGLGVVILDYLAKPTTPTFVYTLDVDDNIVYDQGASVQLEWPATVINEFVKRLGKRYGLYVREQFVYEASEGERKISQ